MSRDMNSNKYVLQNKMRKNNVKNIQCSHNRSKKEKYKQVRLKNQFEGNILKNANETINSKWWIDMISPDCEYNMEMSGKLVVLDQILKLASRSSYSQISQATY